MLGPRDYYCKNFGASGREGGFIIANRRKCAILDILLLTRPHLTMAPAASLRSRGPDRRIPSLCRETGLTGFRVPPPPLLIIPFCMPCSGARPIVRLFVMPPHRAGRLWQGSRPSANPSRMAKLTWCASSVGLVISTPSLKIVLLAVSGSGFGSDISITQATFYLSFPRSSL